MTTDKRGNRPARKFSLPAHDLPKQVDVLLVGADGDNLGEVVTRASPVGQRAVERVFPGAHIAWREVDDKPHFPDDWREFCFIVPQVVNIPGHGLPRDLLAKKPLDDLSPDQFAFLMMMGANRQGVRAALEALRKALRPQSTAFGLAPQQMRRLAKWTTHADI